MLQATSDLTQPRDESAPPSKLELELELATSTLTSLAESQFVCCDVLCCASVVAVVSSLRWMLHSTLITELLADLHGAVMIGDDMNTELGVETSLVTLLHCSDARINSGDSNAVTSGGAPGSTIHPTFRKILLMAFSAQFGREVAFVRNTYTHALAHIRGGFLRCARESLALTSSLCSVVFVCVCVCAQSNMDELVSLTGMLGSLRSPDLTVSWEAEGRGRGGEGEVERRERTTAHIKAHAARFASVCAD